MSSLKKARERSLRKPPAATLAATSATRGSFDMKLERKSDRV